MTLKLDETEMLWERRDELMWDEVECMKRALVDQALAIQKERLELERILAIASCTCNRDQ